MHFDNKVEVLYMGQASRIPPLKKGTVALGVVPNNDRVAP